jgi:hypothetical protein
MSETQQLIARIKALAEKQNRATSTLSAQILGSGKSLSDLEAGKTITLAKYERAMAELDQLEREQDAA